MIERKYKSLYRHHNGRSEIHPVSIKDPHEGYDGWLAVWDYLAFLRGKERLPVGDVVAMMC